MLERFVGEAREVVAAARDEARAAGSAAVEAEHLLLALAAPGSGLAGEVLAAAGLGPPELRAALDAEWVASLRAAGVTMAPPPPPPAPATRVPRWGTSAKDALARGLGAAQARGDRRIGPGHVLLGVLGAREGTVPRALAGAGVPPADLAARVGAALDRERGTAAA